jgi:hypothetical protein
VGLFVLAGNATRCGVRRRDEPDKWSEQDWPRLLGGVISTLPDSTVDDQLSDTECEETRQVVIMIAAATLTDGVPRLTSWSGEIERYWVALSDCLTAGLAHRVAVGR